MSPIDPSARYSGQYDSNMLGLSQVNNEWPFQMFTKNILPNNFITTLSILVYYMLLDDHLPKCPGVPSGLYISARKRCQISKIFWLSCSLSHNTTKWRPDLHKDDATCCITSTLNIKTAKMFFSRMSKFVAIFVNVAITGFHLLSSLTKMHSIDFVCFGNHIYNLEV